MGVYPATGLADARRKRDEARSLLANGVDPSANRQAGRLLVAAEAAPPVTLPTFREVAEEYAVKVRRQGRKQPTMDKLHWCLAMTYPAHLAPRCRSFFATRLQAMAADL